MGTWEGGSEPRLPERRRRGPRCGPTCRDQRGQRTFLASEDQRFPDKWQLRRSGGSPERRLKNLKPWAAAPRAQRLQGPLKHTPLPLNPDTPPLLPQTPQGVLSRTRTEELLPGWSTAPPPTRGSHGGLFPACSPRPTPDHRARVIPSTKRVYGQASQLTAVRDHADSSP